MDYAAFEYDVWENINDGLFTDQESEQEFGGVCITIGETWQGALYGAEENNYGQRVVLLFDTEEAQQQWFDAVTSDMNPPQYCKHAGLIDVDGSVSCDRCEWCVECESVTHLRNGICAVHNDI